MKSKIFSLAAAVALVLAMSSTAKADSFDWTLAPGLSATANYSASGGTFTLTFTITNNNNTAAGIYDWSLQLTGGGGSDSATLNSGLSTGDDGAGFRYFDDTKQNNGSGTTCTISSPFGSICVDYSGGFDTIAANGGTLTYVFTGTYTGAPDLDPHLQAQGCVDTSQTWTTHHPDASGNCPFNGAGSYNISLDGTPQVPEPGSLMLFGTGLLGMAGFVRRKFMS